MDDEKINISVRKFLKNVGITSQRKIEEFERRTPKLSGALSSKHPNAPVHHGRFRARPANPSMAC